MARLSVAPRSSADAKLDLYIDELRRRAQATPPGTCPVAVQVPLLQEAASQTCGKCVPCRDGLPQLAAIVKRIAACNADEGDLERARGLAKMIGAASDCAIGYRAAQTLLQGMEDFASEFESHVGRGRCERGIGQTVPCETKCPAHVDIPGYIALVEQGDCVGAVQRIRKDNPFPTACALVCEHPCEERCRRMLIDASVNIRGVKKYAVDNAPADTVPVPGRLPDTGRRIAVIGGGPSGMTCAYFSALMGHSVTVFEAHKELGGMMRYGIPAYRFPRERLDEDIRAILSTGNIEVEYEHAVDAVEMKRIAEEYDAVYVAVGAQLAKPLRLDGIDAEGVIPAVELLARIGDGDCPDFSGKKVVVVGGGNVAMDCARTAVRAGGEVSIAYRRRVEDMTALDAEIESAMQEGVEMLTLESPVRIEVDESGACAALVTQPQYISYVKGGRPAPVDAAKPERRIEADVILVAVGQGADTTPFEEFGMASERGRFVADEYLLTAGYDHIFTGGDCNTGPKTVIMAIGAGKVAARNIDEYLGYHHKLDCGVAAPPARPNDTAPCGRVNIAERPARERKFDFGGVECPVSTEEVMQECSRCLRCDHFGTGAQEGGRVQYV